MTNEIKHFGVKGMKWRNGAQGVPPQQQAPAGAGSQAPRQIPKTPIDPHTIATEHAIADHNAAMTKTNADLEQIHQKYAQQLKGMAQSSPERQKAYNEAKQAHVDNMNKAAHAKTLKNPNVPQSKTPPKKYGIVERNPGTWGVHLVNPIRHGIMVSDQAGNVQPSDILFHIKPHMKNGVPHKMPPIEILHHSDGYDDIEEAVLAHHGVKGMKWGVRKDAGHEGERVKTKQLAKLDKQYEHNLSGMRGWVNVQNRMAEHMNAHLDEMNAKPEYAGKRNLDPGSPTRDAYLRDYHKLIENAAKDVTKELGTNASGTKRLVVTRYGDDETATWAAHWEDVAQHAAMNSESGYILFKPVVEDGNITDTTISFSDTEPEGAAQHAIDLGTEFLMHHGVKGMKWGVRRTREALAAQTPRNRSAARDAKEADRQAHATADHKKVEGHLEKAKTHGTSALTNQDLREVNDRLNLEQNFNRLTTPQKSAGRKFTEDLLRQEGQNQVRKAVAKQVAKKAVKTAAVAAVL